MKWGSWNIRLYYSPKDVTQAFDSHADTILTTFLNPIIGFAQEQGWVQHWTFLRFAESGYHIRLAVYGDTEVLQHEFQPWLTHEWNTFVLGNAELFDGKKPLSPHAQILNRKLGHSSDTETLTAPGSIIWEWSDDVLGGNFKSLDEFQRSYRFQSIFAEHSLALIELGLDLKTRKSLVRLFIDDLLRVSGLTTQERYNLLQRLKSVWIDYFELSDSLLARYTHLIEQKSADYYAFFQRKQSSATSLKLLPQAAHTTYQAMEQSAINSLPTIMGRTETGEPDILGLTLITGLIHLLHNRLSLPITDEVYLTLMLSDYYKHVLDNEYHACSQILFSI